MQIMSNLTRAAEVLSTYSDGRLPEPVSVSIGGTFIALNMRDAADVARWSESADVVVRTERTKPNEITGQQYDQAYCDFKHDGMIVYVSSSVEVRE